MTSPEGVCSCGVCSGRSSTGSRRRSERLARWCGHPPPPHLDPWQLMAGGGMESGLSPKRRSGEALEIDPGRDGTRRKTTRCRPPDRAINWAIRQATSGWPPRCSARTTRTSFEYERAAPPCEIHKGALAFDVARAYLLAWDFFAAMHYFELAEAKPSRRRTTKRSTSTRSTCSRRTSGTPLR